MNGRKPRFRFKAYASKTARLGRKLRFPPGRLSLRTLTVRDKLVLYALLMLVPVLVFAAIYWSQSQRVLEAKAGELITESLGLSMSWMDELLNGAVRISAAVEADSKVRDFLLKHKDTPLSSESLIAIREIQNRISELLRSENRSPSVWIYFSHSNEVLSTQYGYYRMNDYEALNWLQKQQLFEHLRAWVYPDAAGGGNMGSMLDLREKGGDARVSFARVLPNTSNGDKHIVLGVGYLEFTLQDILIGVAQKTKTSLFLFNKNGQLMQQSGEDPPEGMLADGFLSDSFLGGQEKRAYSIAKGSWLVASSMSNQTGWTLVSVAPLDNYMGELKLLNRLTIGFTAVAILFALFTVRSLTRGFYAPLHELLVAMKRMEAGDLSVRLHYDRKDEFNRMADGFNRLVETHETLIRTVYEERIAKQQAEMNFLTSQINPHFLYNTLGALYSMAKRVDDTLASSLLAISRMFRLSLNKGRELVTVKDSIDLITNYVQLLNIRNPDKYKLEAYVEPSAEGERIPTLLLQPVVENAVKHGLELLPHSGTIRISVTLLSSSILIMISDNGTGLSPDELARVRLTMKAEDKGGEQEQRGRTGMRDDRAEAGSGYALHNIYRRLSLQYGTRFTFQIDSEWQKGTTVTLRIPREDVKEA